MMMFHLRLLLPYFWKQFVFIYLFTYVFIWGEWVRVVGHLVQALPGHDWIN